MNAYSWMISIHILVVSVPLNTGTALRKSKDSDAIVSNSLVV